MYTNINTITNYVLREIDNDFEVQIEDWIEAMSRFIDNETGREIYRADTKVRKYDGNGKYQIMVDDFVGNPIVTVNGEVVTITVLPVVVVTTSPFTVTIGLPVQNHQPLFDISYHYHHTFFTFVSALIYLSACFVINETAHCFYPILICTLKIIIDFRRT